MKTERIYTLKAPAISPAQCSYIINVLFENHETADRGATLNLKINGYTGYYINNKLLRDFAISTAKVPVRYKSFKEKATGRIKSLSPKSRMIGKIAKCLQDLKCAKTLSVEYSLSVILNKYLYKCRTIEEMLVYTSAILLEGLTHEAYVLLHIIQAISYSVGLLIHVPVGNHFYC